MKAICIGSAMVDIIAIVESDDVERMTMHNERTSFLLLEQGRKIDSHSITTHIGGGAVNASVSMSRQGIDTSVVIKIGGDSNGSLITDRLAAENIDDSHVLKADELPTGTSVMISSHNRNATIFTQRGANTLLRPSEIHEDMVVGQDLVYIASLSNRSADCFPSIIDLAKKSGAFVATNPGIRQLLSRQEKFSQYINKIDLLAINNVEAESLVPLVLGLDDVLNKEQNPSINEDSPRLMYTGLKAGNFELSLPDFCSRMMKRGLGMVVITDGTKGAYLANSEGIYHCPSLRVEPKGTAGAGDAFISTISAQIAGGASAKHALQAATVNASAVVAMVDTQSGLLKEEELTAQLNKSQDDLPILFWAWSDLGSDLGK